MLKPKNDGFRTDLGPPREPKISKKHWRVLQKSTFPAFRFEAPLVPLRDPFSTHFGAPNGLQNGPESTPKITSKFVPSKDAQIGFQRPSKGPQVGPQIGPKSASDPAFGSNPTSLPEQGCAASRCSVGLVQMLGMSIMLPRCVYVWCL